MDDRPAMRAEPNVTPMIDVLLVLLILFMLLVPLLRARLDVQLPDPSAEGGGPSIVLEVGLTGRLSINRRPVAEAELGARLRAIYTGRPESVILVRADPRVRYQAVVAAMDSARGAGVRVIGLDARGERAP